MGCSELLLTRLLRVRYEPPSSLALELIMIRRFPVCRWFLLIAIAAALVYLTGCATDPQHPLTVHEYIGEPRPLP
jgi:hypothetical protein